MKHLLLTIILLTGLLSAAQAQLRPAGEPVMIHDDISNNLQRPVPSPDGSMLALTGNNFTGIWLMDQNGDNLRQIEDSRHSGFALNWSPDGSALVTRFSTYENGRRLFTARLYDAFNGESTELSESQPHMPSTPFFDPAQQHVLVAVSNEVQRFELPPQRQRALESNARPVAKASGERIVIVETNGSVRELRPVDAPEISYLNASLSPDGSKLAFEVYGGNLFVMNMQTGDLTDFGRGYFPTWSPDSRFIAFTRNEDDGYRHTYGKIVAAAADRSQEITLYESDVTIPANPHWSPGQNRIFFDYMNSGTILYIDVLTD